MDILLIGSGGREHAICYGLKKSKLVDKIYCAPGNPGMAEIAECVEIPSDNASIADFAAEKKVGLVVIGPEAPLCQGVADAVRAKGIPVFGPSGAAARLEGSKDFSKAFMVKYKIPTAAYATFTDKNAAVDYIHREYAAGRGVVVKADGLAAGKGVIVASNEAEAIAGVEECFAGAFGNAGYRVVIEELLEGEEASILALTDGRSIIPLVSSQDHKRQLDGDKGPNTGGMGAYSPAPVVTEALLDEVRRSVLENFLRGIQMENLDYRGIIYAGIMVTKNGPKVLEFNVRFGDPETQAVLTRFDGDLADTLLKTANRELDKAKLVWSPDSAVCIVLASGGYPGSVRKGFEIHGIKDAEADGAIVYHAGTAVRDGKLINAGGRVLGVTARGKTIEEAVRKAYEAVGKIGWDGMQYRKDIARRAFNR